MTTLEAEATKVRLTRSFRGKVTGEAYYLAGAVIAVAPTDAESLIDSGVAVEAPADAPIDLPAEDANGMPVRPWAPAPPPPAPPPEPEPEPESWMTKALERRQREMAAAQQAAADNARRLSELDAFMAGDYPAKFEDLARRVAALEARQVTP